MEDIGSASVLINAPMGTHSPTATTFGAASECIGTVPNSLLRDPFLPPPSSLLPKGLRLLKGETVLCVVPSGCALLSQSIGEGSPVEPKSDQSEIAESDTAEITCLLTNYRLYFQASACLPAIHIPHTAVARVEVGAIHCAVSLRFDVRRYAIFFQNYVSATGICTTARECCRIFCSALLRCVDPIEGTPGIFAFQHGESIRSTVNSDNQQGFDIQTEIFDIWQKETFLTNEKNNDFTLNNVHYEEETPIATTTEEDDSDDSADQLPFLLSAQEQRERLLGWHGGYNIYEEMSRTKLDAPDSCW
ncbi:hypothetical protein BDF19DRAFT_15966 [Syncephalis fuscata]|nr:hypothetical protein BDF19DRAFT_15966 [Syncephalis fuscata]